MEAISYEYTRQRKDFGRHPSFTDTKVEIVSAYPKAKNAHVAEKAIKDRERDAAQWVVKPTNTIELDCTPEMSEHWVNTERYLSSSRGTQHTQGAWPKDVKVNDVQDRERFLRRIENLPQYQQSVRELVRVAEKSIQQNATVDIYETYFKSSGSSTSGGSKAATAAGGKARERDDEDDGFALDAEPPSAKTRAVFRDRAAPDQRRAVTKLSWHPEEHKLAVAYSVLQFQQAPESMPLASYIWDVANPNEPDAELLPASTLSSLVFNPRTQDHLVGGCYNGQVAFWDLRKSKDPVDASLIEHSHRDPVYDLQWVQSRTGNECVSASTDGQLLWWDVRKISSGPTDSMMMRVAAAGSTELLPPNAGGGFTYGLTSLEYRSDAGATRYLVGTEQGQLLLVDRKAKKEHVGAAPPPNPAQLDSTKSIKTVFGAESGRHHGPVYSVQRHPFAPKYFASIGDWTARVWMEDIKTPLLTTPYSKSYLSGGCWSPTRPGVLFTAKTDGTLDVFDLFYKQSEPVFSTRVGESTLSAIKVHSSGKLVAVGSQDGSTTVLELGSSLSDIQPNEKQSITQMLERETKREKNLEIRTNQRKREQNAERRKAGDGSSPVVPAATASTQKSDDKLEEAVRQATAEFWRLTDDKSSAGSAAAPAGAGLLNVPGSAPAVSASPSNAADPESGEFAGVNKMAGKFAPDARVEDTAEPAGKVDA